MIRRMINFQKPCSGLLCPRQLRTRWGINQQGRVYQKSLGPNTAKLASATAEYNPDPTWNWSKCNRQFVILELLHSAIENLMTIAEDQKIR
jgi:DUF2950 family protein